MECQFFICLNKRQKPKFDAHIDGILLDKTRKIIPIIFNKGRSLVERKEDKFYIEMDAGYSESGKLRDRLSTIVNNSAHLFIVSEKLALILKENTNDQIEFFDLTILGDSVSLDNYKIGNIINKIDCIDYENSEIDFEYYDDSTGYSGDIITTHKLVLKEGLIPQGLYIFLLKRFKDDIIVIHKNLKKIIMEREITGMMFCDINNFQC